MIVNCIAEATQKIEGFGKIHSHFVMKLTIKGVSQRTIEAYTRTVAQIALHFNLSPLLLTENQLNEYLFFLKKTHTGPSAFKFAIYALRSLFSFNGKRKLKTKLPSIPQTKKLPVVLSTTDCKRLINQSSRLRNRFLIAFMYSSGLRVGEIANLKISDVDVNRMQIHVKQGKGNKDRYVPLSRYIAASFDKYLQTMNPTEYLFNSIQSRKKFSVRGIQRIIRATAKACGLSKGVSAHVLRHSYATHLLESGVDLLTIKNVLGHQCIKTTMIYLHVAKPQACEFKNPLDLLFNK